MHARQADRHTGKAGRSPLATRLEAHVRSLAGRIGERNVYRPAALAQAAEYIERQWGDIGYTVAPQVYDVDGIRCSNLEVTSPGRRRPDDILLIGAHYDSVIGSPGANDNGSGVAAMLEISRLVADAELNRSVRFVAFVNEEPPFFLSERMGSMVYARAARDRGDDIRLMVSLETIGYFSERHGSQHYPPLIGARYPDRGNFIAFVSNFRSRRTLRRFAAAFGRHSRFPAERLAAFGWIPGVSWSDHQSFWRYGYDALMVTDTAIYRYPHYHAPTDMPDELDYDALSLVTEGLAAAVVDLATEPGSEKPRPRRRRKLRP